jgi:hypothetical protein
MLPLEGERKREGLIIWNKAREKNVKCNIFSASLLPLKKRAFNEHYFATFITLHFFASKLFKVYCTYNYGFVNELKAKTFILLATLMCCACERYLKKKPFYVALTAQVNIIVQILSHSILLILLLKLRLLLRERKQNFLLRLI